MASGNRYCPCYYSTSSKTSASVSFGPRSPFLLFSHGPCRERTVGPGDKGSSDCDSGAHDLRNKLHSHRDSGLVFVDQGMSGPEGLCALGGVQVFFSYFFWFFFVFFVVLGSVAKTTHSGISLRAEAAHSVNRCVPCMQKPHKDCN